MGVARLAAEYDPFVRRLTASSVRAFEMLGSPVWVFDLDDEEPWWANRAALDLFKAPDVETLRARLARDPMTTGTRRRLSGYREAFSRDEVVHEEWTLYPEGVGPILVRCRASGVKIVLDDGDHLGVMFEGRAVENELGAHERRLVEALRHCNELISLHAPDGSLITRNPAALEAFGTRPLGELFTRAADRSLAKGWSRTREPARGDVPMTTRSGTRWFDTEIRGVQDPITGREAVLVVQHDISRVRATLEELQTARDEADALRDAAEAASRAKSVFLATMSHELRTPMTGVLAAAELLGDSPLDGDQQEALSMVVQGGTQMVALIDDVLHVARDELGETDPLLGPVELVPLIEATLRPLAVAAVEKGVRLTACLDPGLPPAIRSDPRRLRQIVTNLVANAIRYTDEGSVELSVRPEGEVLCIDVVDTGIGIGDDPERLFRAFHQESTERGGTGLGLHISGSLVAAFGGEIGARRNASGGSTFWVRLPLEVAEPETAKAPQPHAGPLGLRLLVVDDNALNRRAFSRILRRWKCKVAEAEDGLAALACLDASSFDAVLMDINMPRMDGFEATRCIRRRYGSAIPIIALTADTLRERDDDLFDGLLHKPVDWQVLHATLHPIAEGRGVLPPDRGRP